VGTSFVGRRAIGAQRIQKAIATGFKESGQILILTGVGGSLAATIAATGLGDILGKSFTANTAAPLLTVWFIAAVLHAAIGSVTISAITSAGSRIAVRGPLTSNTFWLLQSLMDQTIRGALKTCTVGVSVASVVAILLILPLSALM
jgi:H+/gluconate symporter-like permease